MGTICMERPRVWGWAFTLDTQIIQAVAATFGTCFIGFITYITAIRGKRVDANEAALVRLQTENVDLRKNYDVTVGKLDKSREDYFGLATKHNEFAIKMEKQLARLEGVIDKQGQEYTAKISTLRTEHATAIQQLENLHTSEMRDLRSENTLLRTENRELKEQLAEATAIGGTERRHGQNKSRLVEEIQKVEITNSPTNAVPVSLPTD